MSKHSPTVLSNSIGGATALAVPVQSDPLVLERTVNHIIYQRNGNGNGNGNGHGNGHDEHAPFLYAESDLKNIIFPVGSDIEPSPDLEPEAEPEPEPEESYAQSADPVTDEAPAAEAEERWEQTATGTRLPVIGAAIGTPMAAGAAHALASMGAFAQAPDSPAFQPQEVPGGQMGTPAAEHPSEPIPDAQNDSPAEPPGDDFFAGAPTEPQSVPARFDANPPATGTPMTSGFDSAAEPQATAPQAVTDQQIQTMAAPVRRSEPETIPPSSPAQFKQDPAPTSAQASNRQGLMDFFSATSTNAVPTPQPADTGITPAPSPDLSASFTAGSQASIIQNAIQAAAGISAQSNTAVEPERQTSPGQNEEKKKSSKKPAKKSLRPSPKDDRQEEEEEPKSSSKKGKLETGKSKRVGLTESSKTGKSSKKASEKSSKSKNADSNIELMGFSLPSKVLKVAGVLILFVGLPLMVLVANLTSIIGSVFSGAGSGAGQSMSASAPALMTGEWDLAFSNPNGSVGQGVVQITQSGNSFQGSGMDKAPFQIAGSVNGNKVTFNKQYVQAGQPVGKPITYGGQIDYANENPPPGQYFVHMSGIWQLTKREGYSWRAQVVSMTGKWEARLTKRGMGGGMVASQPGTPVGMGMGSSAGAADVKDPKKAHDFFMKVALGIIGIGVALAMVSLKFFGPSGLLNIWAKKEYIPSQFKSQHFKMVAEMGKPLRPGGIPLGTRNDWGIHQFFRPRSLNMPPDLREQNPHMLILGAGAKGKSRLMASMIANDIEGAERAVVVVDSDGALVDLLMNWIAAHPKGKQMARRVIVIDPTHDGEPICYNPLEFPDDGDLQNAASSIVFGFKAIYTEPPGSQSQWNQQTANILRNSAVLLMANGRTLTDLPVLLSDNDFRDILLEKVERIKHEKSEYTTLIDAWSNYKRLARTDQWINWIEPILNRVQPMLGDPRIRPILTQPKSDLNLQDIIREKKILFVKIPQGQLDQNGNLLGSLMVTGVKQAALSLSVRGKDKKRPCAIYLDEFDTFIEKETFDAITSETRKFQLGFCGASKTLQTLPEDYRNQLVINVGMMAVFALAKKDGDMLGPQMFRVDGRKVKHQTIQNVFNKVNTSPQFELISDEEKLNIDRVVGQEERTYFCYRVGTVAGVFNMKTPEFKDVLEKDINLDILEQMFNNRISREGEGQDADDEDEEEDEDE